MEHLDEQTLRAALDGDQAAVAHFRAHLAFPCDVCEAFLEQTPWLDGFVDQLLLSKPAPRRRSQVWAVGVGIAASLLLLVGRPVPPASAGHKGSAVLSIELSAAVRSPSGVLRRIDPGGRVSAGDVLLLRYHATDTGEAMLLQATPEGLAQPLGVFDLSAGMADLARQDSLMGITLEDLSGPVTFWLVASPSGSPTLAEARQAIQHPADDGHAVAGFPAVVEAGHHPGRP